MVEIAYAKAKGRRLSALRKAEATARVSPGSFSDYFSK